MKNVLFRIVAISTMCIPAAYAEPTLTQLQTEMISPWLVTVEGEDRTRILRITGAEKTNAETLQLEAVYGWTDARQTQVKGEVSQTAQERKLLITTQADSKIVATQTSSGLFTGTFTTRNGWAKAVRIEKRNYSAYR